MPSDQDRAWLTLPWRACPIDPQWGTEQMIAPPVRAYRRLLALALAAALALRDGAPALFKTLTGWALARFSTAGLANTEVPSTEAQRTEGDRIAVSNYAVLLDEYARLLRELGSDYDQPRGGRLAQLAERSIDLIMRAEAWRRTLAGLRTELR